MEGKYPFSLKKKDMKLNMPKQEKREIRNQENNNKSNKTNQKIEKFKKTMENDKKKLDKTLETGTYIID